MSKEADLEAIFLDILYKPKGKIQMRIKVITFATLLAATSAAIPAYGAQSTVSINSSVSYEKLENPTTIYRVGNNGELTVNGDADIYALINNSYLNDGDDRGTQGGGTINVTGNLTINLQANNGNSLINGDQGKITTEGFEVINSNITFKNAGTFTTTSFASTNLNLENTGTFEISNAVDKGNFSYIDNKGTLRVGDSGSIIYVSVWFKNSGTISSKNGEAIGVNAGNFKNTAEKLELTSVTTGSFDTTGDLNVSGDVLVGNLTLNNGNLTIGGNLSSSTQNAVNISQGQGNIVVNGDATLKGTIDKNGSLSVKGTLISPTGNLQIYAPAEKFNVQNVLLTSDKSSSILALRGGGTYEINSLKLSNELETGHKYSGIQLFESNLHIGTMQIDENTNGMLNFYSNDNQEELRVDVDNLSVDSTGTLFLNAQNQKATKSVVNINNAHFANNSAISEKDSDSLATKTIIQNLVAEGMSVATTVNENQIGLKPESVLEIQKAVFTGGQNNFSHEISGTKSITVSGEGTTVSFNDGLKTEGLDSLVVGAGTEFKASNSLIVKNGANKGSMELGGLTVNGTYEISGAVRVTSGGFNLSPDSTLIYSSEDNAPLITGTEEQNFTVGEGATILINGPVAAGQNIKIASGFGEIKTEEGAKYLTNNRVIDIKKVSLDENGELVVGTTFNNAAVPSALMMNTLAAVAGGQTGEGANRINNLLNSLNRLSNQQVESSLNSIALMGAGAGAQTTALNVTDIIQDSLNLHGSKLAAYPHNETGLDLWIDVNGLFSKANDYSAGSVNYGFKSDLAGVTFGGDYAFGNEAAIGLAVSLGKGSVRGQGNGSGINNDIDYYGINLYGILNTSVANLIGSVGFLHSKNEIKQMGFKGKPDANSFSVGVRAEKPLSLNDRITVTPHVGVKYVYTKLDSFNAGGFRYSVESANLVQVPFGVAFNANLEAPCGAKVKPFIDLTIAPNFGDKKVSNKVGLAITGTLDSFDARIANNAVYKGKVGLEAAKGKHSFGLNYGIGGGNRGRVDQTLQAKYLYKF